MEYWNDGLRGGKTINPFLPLSIPTVQPFQYSIIPFGMGEVGNDIILEGYHYFSPRLRSWSHGVLKKLEEPEKLRKLPRGVC
jgi:hypothetical protein